MQILQWFIQDSSIVVPCESSHAFTNPTYLDIFFFFPLLLVKMGKANSANATTTITESNNQQEKIQITRASLDTTVVYTTHRSKIFSYGNAQIRIFSYANSASLHETKITVTNGIASHKWCSIAYDGQRYLYVFGGISDELRGTVNKHGQRNNLYCYDFTSGTWSCLDEHCPTRPLARNSGTLLYRESAHSLIVWNCWNLYITGVWWISQWLAH